jgi:5'-3' exonuclease
MQFHHNVHSMRSSGICYRTAPKPIGYNFLHHLHQLHIHQMMMRALLHFLKCLLSYVDLHIVVFHFLSLSANDFNKSNISFFEELVFKVYTIEQELVDSINIRIGCKSVYEFFPHNV